MNADARMVKLMIDGRPVEVPAGTTVLEAARELKIDVPGLSFPQAVWADDLVPCLPREDQWKAGSELRHAGPGGDDRRK